MTFRPSLIAAAVLLSQAPAALAAGSAVEVQVELDANKPEFNRPLVTVSVCANRPGSGHADDCVQVHNVLLDTGSSGLQLRADALTADLAEKLGVSAEDPKPGDIHYCGRFPGHVMWGQAASAWVGLGDVYTTGPIGIAVLKPSKYDPPNGCHPSENLARFGVNLLPAGVNGILGVAPLPNVCSKFPNGDCPTDADSAPYFQKEPVEGSFDWVGWKPVVPPTALELANPVSAFPVGANDGVVLQMSALSPAELKAGRAMGTLYLGVEAWSAELFPPSARKILLTGSTLAVTGGINTLNAGPAKDVQTLFDSGSPDIGAPRAILTLAQGAAPASWYLWLTAKNAEGQREFHGSYRMRFVDASNIVGSSPESANVRTKFESGGNLLLGMPFFYGRTIAFGIADDPRKVVDGKPSAGFLMIEDPETGR